MLWKKQVFRVRFIYMLLNPYLVHRFMQSKSI